MAETLTLGDNDGAEVEQEWEDISADANEGSEGNNRQVKSLIIAPTVIK